MKKQRESAFEQYRRTLSEAETERLAAYFAELDAHVLLAQEEKTRLRADFENALLHYAAAGVELSEAMNRLAIGNLGGFYARPPILWYPLDDAAKIYPLSMRHGRMAVFRLSAYLKEPVAPALLQMALTFTIKRFPSFATTVKKGFFWHYLDTAKRRYAIEPEVEMPCKPLPIGKSGSQSFRVLHYENRISVEYFHVLTDGTGGMVFLKTLCAEYLRLCGVEAAAGEGVLDINETPLASEAENGFELAARTEKRAGFVDRPAVQMSGRLAVRRPCRVLHFRLDAAALRAAASANNATVTAYVLALLFLAGRAATDELTGTMSIQVPVNMRKFYPSDTLRNFSMYCGVKLPLGDSPDRRALIAEITRQLNEKASREAMGDMMNATESMVRLLRYIPLAVKAPVARVVYGFLGEAIFSNTLSNLGVVTMSAAYAAHIESMDFVLGTALTNRASCSMVTFGNTATLTVAKSTADPSFEEALYRLLEADGIPMRIEGSGIYEA